MDYVGYVDEVTRFCVAGWVADRDDWKRSVSVDVLVGGQGRGVVRADISRAKLDELHPEATGRYAFRVHFPNPLSMYEQQEVSVRVTGSSFYLTQDQPVIDAIAPDPAVSVLRPMAPVLLTTMGRTGSTAVMASLAQHPNIVVAGTRPFEVELGCYYAYALRTHVANADHEKSLATDRITAGENKYHIGFNPYFRKGHAEVFKNPMVLDHFMTNRLPARLASAFREIILDYYEEVARDQAIDYPIFFAEKTLPERDSRLGIRYMFPKAKEILLIRDLRDVVCSARSSNGSAFDRVMEATKGAARQLQIIDSAKHPRVMLLKYEDFVLDNARSIGRLFGFLGLAPTASDQDGMTALFATHATSATPAASIGRWRNDLTAEQRQRCEELNPFLNHFGYEI
ncbi:sulfotransferase [Rhodopila sp.]|uniref:sulfotransferase n=1 Tax=Rhodopila sp. TaxID=2480087 RepID=UPI003D1086C3